MSIDTAKPDAAVRRPGAAARLVTRARRLAGLTQRELAAAAGVPQATIGRIESGACQPKVETVLLLVNAAGFELDLCKRAGRGVDRSLLRERLDAGSRERARRLQDDAGAAARLRRAGRG